MVTSVFTWVWNDQGSGATKSFEAHHPVSQGELRPLGSLGFPKFNEERNGKFAALLVGKNPNSSGRAAVASPTEYTPDGYVSLGDVCSGSWDAPSNDKIWCDDQKSGAKSNCFVWNIGLPATGTHGGEKIPISSETFRANDSWSEPSNDLAQVLTLPNPKRFTEFTASPPNFTKNNIPRGGDTFNRIDQCEVTLPFTVYFPPTDAASLRTINYPFCQLTRKIAWYVHTAHTNNSGGEITDSTTVTKGVTRTLSEEMSHSAGVSISASFGVKGFGMDVSLNYQFTSTTSSSFTECEESSRTQGYTVPPYEATIFLSKRIWIQATRANGSVVLKEINFNANEDIHLIGVSLR